MKFAFFTSEELNRTLTTILYKEHNKKCKATFSEEEATDVVEIYEQDGVTLHDILHLEDLLPTISKYLNVTVSSYDVTEVDAFGVGFVFFF